MVSPLDSPHVLERRLSSREPDDLRELVSRECLTPQVLTGLDSSRSYGVWWYGVKCMKLTPMGDQRRKWSKNLEYERVAVQVPDAGISHEAVDSATDALKRSYRSRKESKHLYELGGMLRCVCCGLLRTGYSAGNGYRYYQCQNRRKPGKDAYPDGATRRADDIEREVMCYVQVLISEREKLRAQIDKAVAKEAKVLCNPDAEGAALERQIEGCLKRRAAYQDQQAAGLMSLEELGEKLGQVKEQRTVAEHELAALRRGQHKIEELEANKRALLEAYSSGLLLVIGLFTRSMRRAVCEMLRLDIIVPPRSMRVRSMVDANVVRMTREVEEYATRFLEVQVNGLSLDGQSLVEFRRAALSPKPTDKVMAEVIS